MKPNRSAWLLGVVLACGCNTVGEQAGLRLPPSPAQANPYLPHRPAAVLDRPVTTGASEAPAHLERPVTATETPTAQ